MLYEVYAAKDTHGAQDIWRSLKQYADSNNSILFSDEKLRQEFEDVVKSLSMPSVPHVVRTVDEFISSLDDSLDTQPLPDELETPRQVDCLVVGAGVTGLLVAEELSNLGKSVLIVERSSAVGGVWNHQANATSRVNTSEPAYRIFTKSRLNIDHTPKRDFLRDVQSLALRLSRSKSVSFCFHTSVTKVGHDNVVSFTRNGKQSSGLVKAHRVFMCVNRRLGTVRRIDYPNESLFKGRIVYGVEDDGRNLDWKDKKVLILGAGAFATENARTALECGA